MNAGRGAIPDVRVWGGFSFSTLSVASAGRGFFIAFFRGLCYPNDRKEQSFSAASNGRRLAPPSPEGASCLLHREEAVLWLHIVSFSLTLLSSSASLVWSSRLQKRSNRPTGSALSMFSITADLWIVKVLCPVGGDFLLCNVKLHIRYLGRSAPSISLRNFNLNGRCSVI